MKKKKLAVVLAIVMAAVVLIGYPKTTREDNSLKMEKVAIPLDLADR